MINAFQNWKVCECIGSGAFGKVYRIVRTEFGHTYEAALKVIEIPQHPSDIETIRHEGMSEKEVTEYFESVVEDIVKEITLMSKLKGNSYIVSYEDHDVVKKKDSFGWEIYIRMELLTPLYAYTEQHQMTMLDVIKMGIHLCNALELCERHHIIHRDIKPENIFVSNNGDFKLGDFGIARKMDQTNGNLSQKGTQSYMAPEIFRGGNYDSTVDIYSLGIVLYRFLNGNRMPFMPSVPLPIRFSDKENAMTRRLAGETMPNPSEASEKLAQIILKACAFQPSERYKKPKQLREVLEDVLNDEENRVLFEPMKEKKFVEKSISNMEKGQDDEQKTVLLIGKLEQEEDPNYIQKEASMQSLKISQEDQTVRISMVPQGKRNRFKVIVGGLVAAFVLIIGVIVLLQEGNQGNISLTEVATEKPMLELTEEPTSTLEVTEKASVTVKPTKKPTVKSTKKPIKKPTTDPTKKPIVKPTTKLTTEIPKSMTEIPRRSEDENSQEVIDVEPEQQQEIIIK